MRNVMMALDVRELYQDTKVQHGSKSDSPPSHRDSFSTSLLKLRYTYYG